MLEINSSRTDFNATSNSKDIQPQPSLAEIPSEYIESRCGEVIGQGSYGVVFKDNILEESLIKRITHRNLPDCIQVEHRQIVESERIASLTNEVHLFKKYYGDTSAEIIGITKQPDQYSFYIRMDCIPGEPLDKLLSIGEVERDDAFAKAVADVTTHLIETGISHNDLHSRNLRYVRDTQTLYPVDFGKSTLNSDINEWVANERDIGCAWNLIKNSQASAGKFLGIADVHNRLTRVVYPNENKRVANLDTPELEKVDIATPTTDSLDVSKAGSFITQESV